MINILYICSGDTFGGAERLSSDLLKRLNKKYFKAYLLCLKDNSSKKNIPWASSINTRIIYLSPKTNLKEHLTKIIKEKNISLIHSHSFRFFSPALIAKELGIPHIWHIHADLRDIYPRLELAEARKILSVIWMLSAKVVTVSSTIGKQFDFIEDKDNKLALIYNGVDKEYFACNNKSSIKSRYGIKNEDLVISMFSRYDPLKRHQDFIDAARYIKHSLKNTKFVIVGEDKPLSYKKRLLWLIKKNKLNKDFILTGHLLDTRPILGVTDVVVLPSLSEGLSLAILEAMAAGKPVVAADIPANKEVIINKETGILVKPKDPFLLAKAVSALLSAPGVREKMGQEGRNRVKKSFDIGFTVKKLESLYSTLIKNA